MHFYTAAFGKSALVLRFPSALAVAAATAAVFIIGRRYGGLRLAFTSSLLFAILPRVAWMGMEARPFAFTGTVAAWLAVVLITALSRNRTSWWVLYGLVGAVGVVVNIYLALVLAANGITLLANRQVTWAQRKAWLIS